MTKTLEFIFVATLLAALTGCQSSRSQTSGRANEDTRAPGPTYTVELIPNPQLTPTSREGDKSGVVYSSNIVAVYMNTNGVNAGVTNAPGPASRGARGQGH